MSLILDGTTGVPVTTVTGTLPVANGGTGGSTSTGTGAVVRSTSPTLTTPDLGTPTAGVLTNCTGISVASLSTASGSAPSYSARAWVNFNGSGTVAIRASGNVSSITDNGVGDYTVNFTTAMADANYSVAGFCTYPDAISAAGLLSMGNTYAPVAGSVRFKTANSTNTAALDSVFVNLTFFR